MTADNYHSKPNERGVFCGFRILQISRDLPSAEVFKREADRRGMCGTAMWRCVGPAAGTVSFIGSYYCVADGRSVYFLILYLEAILLSLPAIRSRHLAAPLCRSFCPAPLASSFWPPSPQQSPPCRKPFSNTLLGNDFSNTL